MRLIGVFERMEWTVQAIGVVDVVPARPLPSNYEGVVGLDPKLKDVLVHLLKRLFLPDFFLAATLVLVARLPSAGAV